MTVTRVAIAVIYGVAVVQKVRELIFHVPPSGPVDPVGNVLVSIVLFAVCLVFPAGSTKLLRWVFRVLKTPAAWP